MQRVLKLRGRLCLSDTHRTLQGVTQCLSIVIAQTVAQNPLFDITLP